jgi:hypothetical protein
MGIATAAIAIGVALGGCGSDATGIPSLSTDPFLTVTLDAQSATMSTVAPYNTLQLRAMPRTATRILSSDSIEMTFVTENAKLSVSPTGLVTALETTPRTWVAVLAHDLTRNITHTDTAFITVTGATPSSPLAAFAIRRPPNDSAKLGITDGTTGLYTDTVVVVATAQDGSDLTSSVSLAFSVSDSSIARVDPRLGIVKGLRQGTVVVRTTTTYYGTTKTDSIQLTIIHPVVAVITAQTRMSSTVRDAYVREFVPNSITIGVGGTVLFAEGIVVDGPALQMDVAFDDPGAAQRSPIPDYLLLPYFKNGSGNIGPVPSVFLNGSFNPDCFADIAACYGAARSFSVAGTYRYHSALYGTTGVIVVTAP